ncbi:VOC family protein [Guptibacillus algicola]|uniref:VOC family protein n=1 Tax=Guptibacillus algicola TaxID=225844 RepID=UPI001CD4C11F|nr:VOC family protein [Alkalihalobacillus algicola]MCA0989506.1 VOC family protein [Alkalihalobacillus algicola]
MKLHHTAIEVVDLEASVSFFQKLGFKEVDRFSTSEEWFVFLRHGDVLIELIEMLSKKPIYSRGSTHLAIEIDNLESWLEENHHLFLEIERYELRGKKIAYTIGLNGEELEWIQSRTASY